MFALLDANHEGKVYQDEFAKQFRDAKASDLQSSRAGIKMATRVKRLALVSKVELPSTLDGVISTNGEARSIGSDVFWSTHFLEYIYENRCWTIRQY